MSVIHAPKKPELDLRMLIFPIVIAMLLLVVFVRLWYFQVVKAEELSDRADSYATQTVPDPAPRGMIYDRNGVLLAGVKSEIVLTATPGELRPFDSKRSIPGTKLPDNWILDKLGQMLGVEPKKLRENMDREGWRPFAKVPIYTGVPIELATRIAESRDNLPGINVTSQPMRYYPDAPNFAHVLGYVWTPDSRDVQRLGTSAKDTPPYVGKGGIEKTYDKDLLGEPGQEEMEIDAHRRPVRLVRRDAPSPGSKLVLTIDADLQRYATAQLKGYKGAVVAIDPSNGEVLCAVSTPTYDTSKFLSGISKTDFEALTSDPDKPLFDRALTAHYAPGSTFKIVTSIAAQEEGKFDPNYTVVCDGGYKIGRGFVACLGHHGRISYREALEKSCNTYFCDLAYRVGEKALRKACEETGLGVREGIDLPNESAGVVPTEKWLAKRKLQWHGGDTVNFGIGQGYVETTPLQMANLLALVANDGVSYRPHVVRAFRGPSDNADRLVEPEVLHKIDLPGSFWSELKTALVGVIDEPYGTAHYRGHIDGLEWGGKTGSAEKRGQTKTNAWFVGFAPANGTKIVIAVVLQDVGHGGDFAAPLARDIVHHYLFKASNAASNTLRDSSTPDAAAESPAAR